MKHSIITGCSLVAFLVLLGMFSCAKQDAAPKAPEVIDHAGFAMAIGGDDGSTKACVSEGYLYWETGDKILMVSNGQINGTLVCTSVDGSGRATFSGEISNFTPSGVNLYFLGNQEVDGMNPEFDLSFQSGSIENASEYTFLKKTGVVLEEVAEKTYSPASAISFDGMISLLNLTLNPAGSPGAESGTLATMVVLNGMKNVISVDLANGTSSSTFAKMIDGETDKTTTSVAPANVLDYSNVYVVAVIPQNATGLTMKVDYIKSDATTESTSWSNINWNTTDKGGKSVTTNWSDPGKGPTIVDTSSKQGYSGQSAYSDENTDGSSHKGGYSGNPVGDQVDNPSGNKPGYSGTDV